MFSTFDGFRREAEAWQSPAREPERTAPPMSRFHQRVDRLFYGALAALAGCVIALIVW